MAGYRRETKRLSRYRKTVKRIAVRDLVLYCRICWRGSTNYIMRCVGSFCERTREYTKSCFLSPVAELQPDVVFLFRFRFRNRKRIAFGESALMPVGVSQSCHARCVESGDLRWSQAPAGSTEILT